MENNVNDNEIDLSDYFRVFFKNKFFILGFTSILTLTAIIYSLVVTETYVSKSLVIVLTEGGAGSLSQIGGGMAASLAQISGVDFNSKINKMLVVLKSKKLAERVFKRLNNELMVILFPKEWDAQSKQWREAKKSLPMEQIIDIFLGHIQAKGDTKKSTVEISCELTDKNMAKKVVEIYLEETQKFIASESLTLAKRNELFLNQQLNNNKKILLTEGEIISNFYKKNEISNVTSIVDVTVNANEPTSYILATQQVKESDLPTIVSNIPADVYLNYLIGRQQVLKQLNSLLEQQYQVSKINSSHEDLVFQMLDPPEIPYRKNWPKRTMITISGFILGLMMSIFIVFIRECFNNMKIKKYSSEML